MIKRRKEVLTKTTNYHEKKKLGQNYAVNFVLADVNGNLKLVLKQPHKNRSVFSFRSPLEFKQIVNEVTSISYPYEREFKE